MIKVITLESNAWDLGIYRTKDENIEENERKYAFESSILNEFIENGWSIKDWKMCQSGSVYRTWTFILEKEDEI